MLDKISNQKLIYAEENDDEEESVTTFDDSSQTSGEDYFYEFLESYNSGPIYTELRPLHISFISDIPTNTTNTCDNTNNNNNPNYALNGISDDCDSLDSIPPLEPVSFAEDSENDLPQGNNAKLSSLILPLYEPNSSLFLNLVKKSLHDLKNNKNPESLNIDEGKCEHLRSSLSMENYSSSSSNNTEKPADWNDMEELDTKGIAEKVTSELRRLNVSQLHFAQKVLGRSQGTLSDLLRNPRPWTKMKSGRETFGRMLKWLQESDAERLSVLTPSSKCASQSKFTTK